MQHDVCTIVLHPLVILDNYKYTGNNLFENSVIIYLPSHNTTNNSSKKICTPYFSSLFIFI